MNGICIVCHNCQQRWQAAHQEPAYLEMTLASQPCPNCEACALGCEKTRSEQPVRTWQTWQRLHQPVPVLH